MPLALDMISLGGWIEEIRSKITFLNGKQQQWKIRNNSTQEEVQRHTRNNGIKKYKKYQKAKSTTNNSKFDKKNREKKRNELINKKSTKKSRRLSLTYIYELYHNINFVLVLLRMETCHNKCILWYYPMLIEIDWMTIIDILFHYTFETRYIDSL
jgi:hypothetical protein